MVAIHAYPQTEGTDPDNVADALDLGLLHWAKGETGEALRCLRAASAAATDAGNDARGLELARAAADLAPSDSAPVTQESAPRPSQPLEPRRSKLPEPPAGPKKFTGGRESEPSDPGRASGAQAGPSPNPSRVPSNSGMAPDAKLAGAGGTPSASTRPVPPSGRPPAMGASNPSSVTPSRITASPTTTSAKSAGVGKTATAQSNVVHNQQVGKVQPTSNATATPLPGNAPNPMNGISAAPSSSVVSGPATSVESTTASPSLAATSSASSAASSGRSGASAQPGAVQEPRTSVRPQTTDHRLASLRVRIDRVEADGTIRLRLLDLAATASGEDNALLVVSQNLWQELKRGG